MIRKTNIIVGVLVLILALTLTTVSTAQDGTYVLHEYSGPFRKCSQSKYVGIFFDGRGAGFTFEGPTGSMEKGAEWKLITFQVGKRPTLTISGNSIVVKLPAKEKEGAEKCRPKK